MVLEATLAVAVTWMVLPVAMLLGKEQDPLAGDTAIEAIVHVSPFARLVTVMPVAAASPPFVTVTV